MGGRRKHNVSEFPPGSRAKLVADKLISEEEAQLKCPWPIEARVEWWERRLMTFPGPREIRIAVEAHGICEKTAYGDKHRAEDRARPVWSHRKAAQAGVRRLLEHAGRRALYHDSVGEMVTVTSAYSRLLKLDLTPDELMDDAEARGLLAKAVTENVSSFTDEQRAQMLKALSKPAKK